MAGVNGTIRARRVSDDISWLVVVNVGRLPARIPIQKETRPMMVMHGFCFAWRRHGDFQNAYKRVLENDFVTIGCCRHGVIPFREVGRILRKTQDSSSAYHH